MNQCPICKKETDRNSTESYFDGDHRYVCRKCGDKVCQWFNELVDGSAGYTTSGEVGIPLVDLVKLKYMLLRDFDMARWVIPERQRIPILKDPYYACAGKKFKTIDEWVESQS